MKNHSNNSHIKSASLDKLVIVKGHDNSSKLLEKAVLISNKKLNKIGRGYHAVSSENTVGTEFLARYSEVFHQDS